MRNGSIHGTENEEVEERLLASIFRDLGLMA
jgi:hypothetical protein